MRSSRLIKTLLCAVGITALFCLTVAAAKPEFTVEVGKDYSVVYADSDKTKLAKQLNMSSGELQKYFSDNGLLMLAVDKDNTHQMRLSSISDSFSQKVWDFSDYAEKELKSLSKSFVDKSADKETAELTVTQSNSRKYICITETLTDSGGQYHVTQYITVADGKLYRLSCYNAGKGPADTFDKVFKSLKINGTTQSNAIPVWKTVIIFGGIVLFSAVAIYIAIGLMRERKQNL